ncbi:hypothetical protein DAPPUDRAFT_320180 [Daphnia pulex]|uniref:Uncharacterized protein n=1 Tax=Daphnia pulex TaxID=6669 RepID=E9GP34_DAPPU|nr:hypothetical protein DAPPUDRAFT_320180 [Daphnia pulex]|eukprot:EFX78751.1 hypothetical protein DAPPUDRAFT_320180 [Daphnia pulex]
MEQEAAEHMEAEVVEETEEDTTEENLSHLDNIPTIHIFALTVNWDLIKRSTAVEE